MSGISYAALLSIKHAELLDSYVRELQISACQFFLTKNAGIGNSDAICFFVV